MMFLQVICYLLIGLGSFGPFETNVAVECILWNRRTGITCP